MSQQTKDVVEESAAVATTPGPAKLTLDGKEYELPVTVGSEGEVGIDIAQLRAKSVAITLDPGYGNTGACESAITFIDGDLGILRYRGYPIEELAEQARFTEVCYLLIYGELPNAQQLKEFEAGLAEHSELPEGVQKIYEGFPQDGHPMAMLSAVLSALSAYYPDSGSKESLDLDTTRILAKMPAIAASAYRRNAGKPVAAPRKDLSYPGNFLRMMFAEADDYAAKPVQERALDLLLILHADHEQNCSTSTVRMVGSSQANLYASVSAGAGALWGPLHGGANQAVIEMLESIRDDGGDHQKYVGLAKDKSSGFRLMGFGHRVYKNFDPRAKILKKMADEVLEDLGVSHDPLLEIAQSLEEVALKDDFFISRKLYPNVDFYSGILYRAMGIPTNLFTVMFALGRMPGWVSHYREMQSDPSTRINRPRQIYTGPTKRSFVALEER
jgi:citrate synthase